MLTAEIRRRLEEELQQQQQQQVRYEHDMNHYK